MAIIRKNKQETNGGFWNLFHKKGTEDPVPAKNRKKFEVLDNPEAAAGGRAQTADEYLHELFNKYGGSSMNDVLARATSEEADRFHKLLYSWSLI